MRTARGSLVAGLLVVLRGSLALNVSPSSPSDRPGWLRRGGPADENGDRDLGTAICIVGDMAHLEVASKIENIVRPFEDYVPNSTGVFLALETGLLEQDRQGFLRGVAKVCASEEMTKTRVAKAFAPYLIADKFVSHVNIPVISERWPKLYAPKLRKDENASASQLHAQRQQIGNALGQMRFQKMCVNMIQEHEKSTQGRYSFVIMVRESTLALRPVVPEKILSLNRLVLKGTTSLGVPDDKVIAMPRKYLEGSLGSLFDILLKVSDGPALEPELEQACSKFSNTEEVLHYTLRANKIPFEELGERRIGDFLLPFVAGRCVPGAHGSKDHWCVVAECTERLPRKPWALNVSCGTKNRYGVGCDRDL